MNTPRECANPHCFRTEDRHEFRSRGMCGTCSEWFRTHGYYRPKRLCNPPRVCGNCHRTGRQTDFASEDRCCLCWVYRNHHQHERPVESDPETKPGCRECGRDARILASGLCWSCEQAAQRRNPQDPRTAELTWSVNRWMERNLPSRRRAAA